MIAMKAKTTESGATPRRYAKELKRINLAAAQVLGEHFHAVNLPRRFTVSGGRMLGYALRTAKYMKQKQKKKGHQDPIVYSGQTKRDVLGTEDVRTSGSSKRWTMQLVLKARNLNRFKRNKNINLADELRRVAAKEHGPLFRVFEKAHEQLTNEIK